MKYFILIMLCLALDFVATAEETNNYLLYKLQSKGIITETEAQVIKEQEAEETKIEKKEEKAKLYGEIDMDLTNKNV